RGHAAAGAKEVAPAQSLVARRLFAQDSQPRLELLLLGRLRRRNEFLVGGDARRDRRRRLSLGVGIALTYPHGISSPLSGWAGQSFKTNYRTTQLPNYLNDEHVHRDGCVRPAAGRR